jgi:lipopolysaccharide export LptBFGC system permease protein LptF
MERLIDPAIADLQSEYAAASRCGLAWRRRWIRIAGWISVWKVLGLHAASRSLPLAREWAVADDRAMGRTIAFSIAPTFLFMVPFLAIPLSLVIHRDAWGYYAKVTGDDLGRLVLYLLPSALPCAIPLGFTCGIACGLRGRVATLRVRRSILVIAAGCCLLTFLDLAWLIPSTNQAYREIIVGHSLPKEMHELSLAEMWRHGFRLAVHMRLALSFATVILGLFAYSVSAANRGGFRSVVIGVGGAIGYASQYILWPAPVPVLAQWVGPFLAAWTPNLLFGVLTVVLLRRLPQAL